MLYFEAYLASDGICPYVPLTSLIAGDLTGLIVPMYSAIGCPEIARFRVSDYLPDIPPVYFVPLYASRSYCMGPFTRPFGAITANVT